MIEKVFMERIFNMKTRLIREYRKKIYFIGVYSIIFVELALVLDRIFVAENKTFIWGIAMPCFLVFLTITNIVINFFMIFDSSFSYNCRDYVNRNTLTNVKIETNKIAGKISTKEKRILQLSLPYSKGYSVYVDGKRVKTFTSGIGYLGVELEKGTHSVEVKYVTYGIIPAATVSVVANLLFILQLFMDRKRKQKM